MTTIDDFPVVNLIGDDPHPGVVLLNAPRPLYGDVVAVDVMGFTVAAPTDERALDGNRRLDARRLVWTSRADAVTAVRARVTDEYGADALDGLSDDDLLTMWRR